MSWRSRYGGAWNVQSVCGMAVVELLVTACRCGLGGARLVEEGNGGSVWAVAVLQVDVRKGLAGSVVAVVDRTLRIVDASQGGLG